MNFVLERIADPDIEPVTLAQAIQQLREFSSISQAAQDELTALIVNARQWVEGETGQALIDQTWRMSIGDNLAWPGPDTNRVTGINWGAFLWRDNSIYLRRTPVLAITKFASVDDAGDETNIDADAYELRDAGTKYPRIVALNGGAWTAGALRIEFRAGYADRLGSPTQGAERVPQQFKQSILLHVEAHYNRDEKMMDRLIEAACNNVARLVAHVPFA